MADRKHPDTHVEDQNVKGVRKQPLSPIGEGIDPLTESDTMHSAEDTTKDVEKDNLTLEEHTDPTNQPSPEQPASPVNKPADADKTEKTADEKLAEDTKPGKADDPTPDAGEKKEDQEPHTDAENTSPANRTKSTSK